MQAVTWDSSPKLLLSLLRSQKIIHIKTVPWPRLVPSSAGDLLFFVDMSTNSDFSLQILGCVSISLGDLCLDPGILEASLLSFSSSLIIQLRGFREAAAFLNSFVCTKPMRSYLG